MSVTGFDSFSVLVIVLADRIVLHVYDARCLFVALCIVAKLYFERAWR